MLYHSLPRTAPPAWKPAILQRSSVRTPKISRWSEMHSGRNRRRRFNSKHAKTQLSVSARWVSVCIGELKSPPLFAQQLQTATAMHLETTRILSPKPVTRGVFGFVRRHCHCSLRSLSMHMHVKSAKSAKWTLPQAAPQMPWIVTRWPKLKQARPKQKARKEESGKLNKRERVGCTSLSSRSLLRPRDRPYCRRTSRGGWRWLEASCSGCRFLRFSAEDTQTRRRDAIGIVIYPS